MSVETSATADTATESAAAYLSRIKEARIYPVICLLQTFRDYCLFTTTVTPEKDGELSEESLLSLVRAEVAKLVPAELLHFVLVRNDVIVRSRAPEPEPAANKLPVDRYKLRIYPRNLMTFFSASYDYSVYILPRHRFSSLLDAHFPVSVTTHGNGDTAVSLKSSDTQPKSANKATLMTSVLFKSMLEHTSTNPRDRRYAPVTNFDCSVCMETKLEISKGHKLQACSHIFCKDCLKGMINSADNVFEITCPQVEKGYFSYKREPCDKKLNDLEIMYLLKDDFDSFSKYMRKRQNQNELAKGKDRVHCATPDCTGYFTRLENEADRLPSVEKCSKCQRFNCFKCNQAHDSEQHTCSPRSAASDPFDGLVQTGDVVRCPKCHVYLEKQSAGCQLIRCTFCRMDICWLTKLPRWGPNGKGDISAGCRCGVGGKKCHPNCNNCH